MSQKLILPCPFCGEQPESFGSGEGQKGLMIQCIGKNCPSPCVSYYDHKSAIAVWNRRAASPTAAPAQPVARIFRHSDSETFKVDWLKPPGPDGTLLYAALPSEPVKELPPEEIEKLNPYASGIARENWRRGYQGEQFIGYPGSPAETFYSQGRAAAAPIAPEIKTRPLEELSEEEFFILEAAEQVGFEIMNVGCNLYRCTADQLIDMVKRARAQGVMDAAASAVTGNPATELSIAPVQPIGIKKHFEHAAKLLAERGADQVAIERELMYAYKAGRHEAPAASLPPISDDFDILELAQEHAIGVHEDGKLTVHLIDGTDIAHCVLAFARDLLAAPPLADAKDAWTAGLEDADGNELVTIRADEYARLKDQDMQREQLKSSIAAQRDKG